MNRPNEAIWKLEKIMMCAWPAFESIDYEGWTLRFADGYTKRSNSVYSHSTSPLPLQEKVAHCEAAYQGRGLPTIFRVTPFSQPATLDGFLAERGYETLDPTTVMTCTLADAMPESKREPQFIVSSEAWLNAHALLHQLTAVEASALKRIVQSTDGECCFVTANKKGRLTGCGLGVLVDDAVGLFGLFTHPECRGQGVGSAIVRSILAWAYQRKAKTSFLQVHCDNTTARRLYERCGFQEAYPYWYRIKR